MIKVIAGRLKNSNLITLDNEDTRPTRSRVKEAIFSHIFEVKQNAIVLDLFSGSGSLAIEAYSRGASEIYLNDINFKAYQIIKTNLNNLKCKNCFVSNLDYQSCLESLKKLKFDYIFLDPPYHLNCVNNILNFIYLNKMLNKDGIVIVETDLKYQINSDFILYKEKEYGITKISYLRGEE